MDSRINRERKLRISTLSIHVEVLSQRNKGEIDLSHIGNIRELLDACGKVADEQIDKAMAFARTSLEVK